MDIWFILMLVGGGLLIVVVALVGYFGVPWWKDKRKNTEIVLTPGLLDADKKTPPALGDGARKEPVFSSPGGKFRRAAASDSDSGEAAEADAPSESESESTEADDAPDDAEAADAPAADAGKQQTLPIDDSDLPDLPAPPESLLHAKEFCYVIYFYANDAINITHLQELCDRYQQFRIRCYRILGYDETASEWKLLEQSDYRYFLLAMPLADRGGKLQEKQIKLLEEEGRRFAEKMQIRAIFPSINSAISRGDILDTFCEEVDVVVEFRLSLSEQQPVSQVQEALDLHKMRMENGRAVFRQDSEVLYSASLLPQGSQVQSLLFSLDTPKVTRPLQAFDDMMLRMERIAKSLRGSVHDPQGNPVDDDRAANIRSGLSQVVQKMNENNVPPGGALSHLLFS